jgi:hypothetical protein
MKIERIPKTVSIQIINEALSNKPDNEVDAIAVSLRRRFAKATFKNLLGMSVKQAQRKLL